MFRLLRNALVTALTAALALSALALPALADDHGEVTRIKDIQPGPGASMPSGALALGGKLYFAADDGTHGRELWRTDGTPQNTQRVADINPGASNFPQRLTTTPSMRAGRRIPGTTTQIRRILVMPARSPSARCR